MCSLCGRAFGPLTLCSTRRAATDAAAAAAAAATTTTTTGRAVGVRVDRGAVLGGARPLVGEAPFACGPALGPAVGPARAVGWCGH
jgi:hypothetical protein